MRRTPLDTGNVTQRVAIGMLTLLAALAAADVVGLARILPFIALPLALLVVGAILVWKCLIGEAKVSAAFEVARRDRERGKRR
jgi:hypothetical protein